MLRDGVLTGTGDIADATQADIIRAMVGRTLDDVYPKAEASFGDTVLQVDGFCHATEFDDVSFDLRAGEILGFYGLVGAGRTEVMEALFGLKARKAGELRISGSPANIRSPKDAMAAGLAYVPEDRQRHGAILPFSVVHNISLPQLDTVSNNGFLNRRREEELVDDFGNKVAIKAAGWDQPVAELSGGNQQKVVIGKWLAIRPRIVILDEPTKGIDIGSKAAVHRMIGDLAQQGMAVILVTSELEEALGIADRLVVMARGRVVARFEREAFLFRGGHCGSSRVPPMTSALQRRDLLLFAVIAGLIVVVVLRAPEYMAANSVANILSNWGFLAILALGQLVVLLTRGIDLSQASVLAFTGMFLALLSQAVPELPAICFFFLAILLGAALGAVNAAAIALAGLPPIIATLGTMAVIRGMIFVLSEGAWISSHEMSEAFKSFPASQFIGIPNVFWVAPLVHDRLPTCFSRTSRPDGTSTPSAAIPMPRVTPAFRR